MKPRALAELHLTLVRDDGTRRRVRVCVLPTGAAVAAAFGGSAALARRGLAVQAFFAPRRPDQVARTGIVGDIVLPADGDLHELIPHEAVHAVMHVVGGVHHTGDEELARLVGDLTGRIHARLAALGFGA